MRALLPALFRPIVDFAKLELLRVYLNGVHSVRQLFISLLCQVFAVILALVGFLMIHMALFFLLPFSLQINALILLCVGVLYVTFSVIYVIRKSSVKHWIKLSRADVFKEL